MVDSVSPFSRKMLRALYDSLQNAARAFFLLEAEERSARSLPADRRAKLRKLCEAAEIRTSVAADLSDPRHAVVGVALYCDAVELLLLAAVLMHGEGPSLDTADVSSIDAAFAQRVEEQAIDRPPPELDEVRRLIAEPRLRIGSFGPDALAQRRASLEAAANWLRARIEQRTVSQIRRTRIARLASAAVVIVTVVASALSAVMAAPNVALHRPVLATSRHPQSVAPADNSGLVDGIKDNNYGIHTLQEGSPWVMVDLESSRKIAEVKIYNRGDGWFDEGLPFVLELSEDGHTFTEVSTRTEPFSQTQPWTYSGSTRARFVRVRAPHLGYIALSEIEVFER
jgi:hypothetical protein